MDRHDCIAGIIFSGQKRPDPESLKLIFELPDLRLQLFHHGSVVLLIAHLNQEIDIVI